MNPLDGKTFEIVGTSPQTDAPLQLEETVETERRAGVQLAWIVVISVVVLVLAIVYKVPESVLDRMGESGSWDTNGLLALLVVAPGGAIAFGISRYRDAVGSQLELRHLALHDPLTDLPNRRHLREILPVSLDRSRSLNAHTAVIFVDLDRFKVVNDTHGHEIGDQMMVAMARRLKTGAGKDRMVSRYGGDEFVIVDPNATGKDSAMRFASSLLELIEEPFQVGEDRLVVSASIGIALSDRNSDPAQLLRDADTAMYTVKYQENIRVATFSAEMRNHLTPATAEKRLRAALAEGQFSLLYQPIVALRSGAIVGAEALLRWNDPNRGVVGPGEFMIALEDSGLIVPVGRWIFTQACRQARIWAESAPEGAMPLKVTVNVSPRQVSQSDFVDDLAAALKETGVNPGLIYLELTETALIPDMRAAWSTLKQARALGLGLALDDFGTGYSSLTHLRDFDLELLKLDQSYVAGLGEENDDDDAIVRHVLSLARALGIATLAEGISDPRQISRLVELGCELGQGFYFAEPQPASIIDLLVARLATGPVDDPAATARALRFASADAGCVEPERVVATLRSEPVAARF